MPDADGRDRAPTIRLFTQGMNPFAEKVAAALALKQLAFERVVSDDPEDVARWSPIARTLPVLEIDGRRRADSNAIIDWLDERYPEPTLFSRDPRTAAAQRQLADWSDSSFVWYWNRWRAARYPQPGDEAPVDESFLSRLRESLGRSLRITPRSRADARELEIIESLRDRMNDLEGFLGDRSYFHAEEPSVADLSVYAMLRVLREGPIPGSAQFIEERPRLAAYLERMEGRIQPHEVQAQPPSA